MIAPGQETPVTAKHDRVLHAVEVAAATARDDARQAAISRKERDTAVKQAHKAGVGYGTISVVTGITRSRVAQIVNGRKR